MDITKGQKKIIIATAIVTAVFILFLIFVYLPTRNTVGMLKAELSGVEASIDATSRIIGEGIPLEKGLAALQTRLEGMEKKFPQSEEEVIKTISNIAYKTGVSITSIKPQQKAAYLDKGDKATRIEGKICQQIPVSIVGYATFKKLDAFLEALRKDAPNFSTVDSLTIAKGQQYELNVNLTLTIYLLVTENR